ncbi:MAG: hypothetical protein AAGD25_07335 [Cyanobacteria bacterium P01_F01_bin.150]
MTTQQDDKSAIQALINSQFASLSWSADQPAHWADFETGFVSEAQLFPAARPVKPMTVKSFRTRMEKLRTDGTLTNFKETLGPIKVWVIGQVAVAIAGCEMVENEHTITRDISIFLLVKEEDTWRIAAQGWDVVEDFQSIGL